jgi:hypothetical protein
MSGWNRLFVVIAVCWAIVAPFLLMAEVNRPVEQTFDSCGSTAYRSYGASDSTVRLDWDKYQGEVAKCLAALSRDFVSLPKLLSTLIGMGDRTLGLVAWGFILIPPCLLWVVGWVFGKIGRWVRRRFPALSLGRAH